MKKRTFMTATFFLVLFFGFAMGRTMAGMTILGASQAGLILAFVGMFIGMILTHMHLYSNMHAAQVRIHQMDEKRGEFEKRMRELVGRQNALGDEALLEFSKSVSQRVANKILAAHFDGLAEDSKRAHLFKSVDAIVEEEVAHAALELANVQPE